MIPGDSINQGDGRIMQLEPFGQQWYCNVLAKKTKDTQCCGECCVLDSGPFQLLSEKHVQTIPSSLTLK